MLGLLISILTVRYEFPGSKILFSLTILPLVIPSYIGALTYVSAFSPKGLFVDLFSKYGVSEITGIEGFVVAGIATFTGDVLVGSSATVGFGSTVFFKDGNKVIFGNGEDLSIFHDGSNSFIKDTGTGGVFIDDSG